MASGLPYAQWNNGDVDNPARVDIEAVRDWYASRRVPWGIRVPAGMPWPYGKYLFRKRLMRRDATPLAAAPLVRGLALSSAGVGDLSAVVDVDS